MDHVIVTRDGKPLTEPLSESDAFAWLQHHQPMSVDWATTHEGYAIVSSLTVRCPSGHATIPPDPSQPEEQGFYCEVDGVAYDGASCSVPTPEDVFPRLCAHGITETTDVRCTRCSGAPRW